MNSILLFGITKSIFANLEIFGCISYKTRGIEQTLLKKVCA
jgi:hypothetical protein